MSSRDQNKARRSPEWNEASSRTRKLPRRICPGRRADWRLRKRTQDFVRELGKYTNSTGLSRGPHTDALSRGAGYSASYIRHSFVIVSSKFKIALLTIAHAATLWRFKSGGICFKSDTATLTAAAVRFSK